MFTSWNPHSVSDQNKILCPCILLQTWPTNKYPISDLNHKLPYFRPGPQIVTWFQAWTTSGHSISDLNHKSTSTWIANQYQNRLPISDLAHKLNLLYFRPDPQIDTGLNCKSVPKLTPLLRLKYLRLLEALCANLAPGDKWSEPWVAKVS